MKPVSNPNVKETTSQLKHILNISLSILFSSFIFQPFHSLITINSNLISY